MNLLNVEPGSAEAIVVGSGFGGAVAACRMAQAGIDVLVIERGRRYEAGDFPALPTDQSLLPDLTRWTWQHNQGLWDIVDLEEVVSVQAAGYGGGSLIYANVHLRPPHTVFDDRWPEEYRNPDKLSEYFDLAAFMLQARPIDEHPVLGRRVVKTEQLGLLSRHIGRQEGFFHPPLAINMKEGLNPHGRQQAACTGCGTCCTGCPEGAKNTLDYNYLAVAEAHNARVVTQCEVTHVAQRADGSWSVTCLDHLTARRRLYTTSNLFLCTGSVHTTRLLARARLSRRARAVKSLVGIGYFPNCDALGMVYGTTHAQYPSQGPAITTSTVCWDPNDHRSFFLIQDGGYVKELARFIGMGRAPLWLGRNRLTKHSVATVGPSDLPPLPLALVKAETTVASPLDDALAAIREGAFHAAVSDKFRSDWGFFAGELKNTLLLPEIVDRVIETSILEWLRTHSLTSWLKPNGRVARLIIRLSKALVRCFYGTDDALAGRALSAMAVGNYLKPADIARKVLGYSADAADHRMMLLGMGKDETSGVLHYDGRRDRLVADLDLYHLLPTYTQEEQMMSDMAVALGGELRTSPAWAFLGKPLTVHNQGGCPMSDRPEDGVTTPDGQVHGCDGLFVLDGSLLCSSVGVNPSATITAIAERNILRFIRRHKKNAAWPEEDLSEGACQYQTHRAAAQEWAANATKQKWTLRPPQTPAVPFQNRPLGIGFSEVMQGYYSLTDEAPVRDDEYRDCEAAGRPAFPLVVRLDVSVENLSRFFEDCHHKMDILGSITLRLPDAQAEETFPVRGGLELLVPRRKPYAIKDPVRRRAQIRLARTYTARSDEPRRGERRFMNYSLAFTDGLNRTWSVVGYKNIRDDPALDAWRETSSLFVQLLGPAPTPAGRTAPPGTSPTFVRGAGVVHVDMDGFLFHQLPSLRVTPADTDEARAVWARAKFASYFFGTLQRIYAPEAGAALASLFKLQSNNVRHRPSGPRS